MHAQRLRHVDDQRVGRAAAVAHHLDAARGVDLIAGGGRGQGRSGAGGAPGRGTAARRAPARCARPRRARRRSIVGFRDRRPAERRRRQHGEPATRRGAKRRTTAARARAAASPSQGFVRFVAHAGPLIRSLRSGRPFGREFGLLRQVIVGRATAAVERKLPPPRRPRRGAREGREKRAIEDPPGL